MTTSERALLVLDLQNELVDPKGKVGATGLAKLIEERSVLANAANAIGRFRRVALPIAYVGLSYREDYADVLSVAPRIAKMKEGKVAVRGTWGSEFHPSVAPAAGDIVYYKQWVNPFFQTPLQSWLARHGVRHIAIMGVATNLVVESAARHADDAGFQVNVLEDCCASPNPAWHEFAVTQMLPVFGRVVASSDIN